MKRVLCLSIIILLFLNFPSSFNKIKEDIPPPGAGSKIVFKILFAHFRVTVIIFKPPRQVKKQHFKVKFWNWGPITIHMAQQ